MYRAKAWYAVARAIQHGGQKGQSGFNVMLQSGNCASGPRLNRGPLQILTGVNGDTKARQTPGLRRGANRRAPQRPWPQPPQQGPPLSAETRSKWR